jgi:hypothetical protein
MSALTSVSLLYPFEEDLRYPAASSRFPGNIQPSESATARPVPGYLPDQLRIHFLKNDLGNGPQFKLKRVLQIFFQVDKLIYCCVHDNAKVNCVDISTKYLKKKFLNG